MAEQLLSYGLELYYFAFPSHNPDNFRQATQEIYPAAYEAGLLAAPRSTPVLDSMLQGHGCMLVPIFSSEDLRRAMWRTPRWSMAEWQGEALPQVIALAGRTLRGETFERFLQPDWKPGEMIWQRIERTQATLEEERSLVDERITAARQEAEVAFQKEKVLLEGLLTTARNDAASLQQAWNEENERHASLNMEIHARLQALEELLQVREASAQQQVREARDALAAEQKLRRQVEALLGRAEARSLDRLTELGLLRTKLAEHEANLLILETRTAEFLREVDRLRIVENMHGVLQEQFSQQAVELRSILGSATWRLALPAHRMVSHVPALHRTLIMTRRMGGRLVRFVRKQPRS
jgi:hypothetical protein